MRNDDYTRKKIETTFIECRMGNKIIIPETNGEVRIIGQPIIEKKQTKK